MTPLVPASTVEPPGFALSAGLNPCDDQAAPPAIPLAPPDPGCPSSRTVPTAILRILPVSANLADRNAITATLEFVTDAVVGPCEATIALGTPGLLNHPVGVPVHLQVESGNGAPGCPTWTLTVPSGSRATLQYPWASVTEFTPDVVGTYKVDVVLTNDVGTSNSESVQIRAGTFVGTTTGNCRQCHPSKVATWEETGHAKILSQQIDVSPALYDETCVHCHSTGYYPGAKAGGFPDAQAKTGWEFPTWKQIEAGGNWDAMPPEVKNLSNIQCEVCHGPAKEHAVDGKRVTVASFDVGVCNVCHNGGGHDLKGTDLQSSRHSDSADEAWMKPVGPEDQTCIRCHSGAGFVSFLKSPTDIAAWDNRRQTLGCSSCHDPHSDENLYQLRIVGTPIALPFEAKDVGLSATCEECHNANARPANAPQGEWPHFCSAAELLNDTGGVVYGQTMLNSPHGQFIGAAPITDPVGKTGRGSQFAQVAPGPCVVCHMQPTIMDYDDENYHRVGSHSFNTVSPDGQFDYAAACKPCHGQLEGFDLPAKADYDGNGRIEGAQTEVKGLLDLLLQALLDRGVKKIPTGEPFLKLPENAGDDIKNAVYNFRTVYGTLWDAEGPGNQGKAAAVHNFKRSVMLLQLSYRDLTGQDIPNATY